MGFLPEMGIPAGEPGPAGRARFRRDSGAGDSGPDAEAARRFYCGTIGAEFMHIPDRERRQWIQERDGSGSRRKWIASGFSICSSRPKFSSRRFNRAISAPSAFRSKAKRRCFLFSTPF